MKEIVELRSACAKHFQLEDGKRMAVITTAPQHYLDRDTGRWEDVDPRPEADVSVPGFELNLRKMPYRIRFGRHGYRFGFGIGQYVTWRFADAKAVKPAVDGGKVVYAGLWSSADLVLTPLARGAKEEIVLRDASAPTQYRFALAETGGIEVVVRDGGLAYLRNGEVVGFTPPPTVRDANGQAGQVSLSFADGVLTLAVDPAWLKQAAFPVVIDPTVTIQPDPTAGKDTYVDAYYPTTNYGTATSISVNDISSTYARRALLQFPLSTIPQGAEITAASLSLYLNYANTTVPDATEQVHAILAAWDEATVTWNTQPSFDSAIVSSITVGTTTGWYTWDVRSLVQAWVDGTRPNYGLMIRGPNDTNTSGADSQRNFYSSDYTTDTTLRPKLVITYIKLTVSITSPNGTQASPTQINNDVTPDLVGVYNSSDNVNMAYRQHQVLDEVGNVVWDSGKVAQSATPGSTVTVTVPLGYLRYGRKYRWKWMAWDANGGYSTWSTEGWFICNLTSVSPTDLAASDHLYAITPTGRVLALEEGTDDMGTAIPWRAVYPIPMTEPGTDQVLRRVWVIAEVSTGSTFNVQYSLLPSGDADWSTPYSITPGAGVRVVEIALPIAGGAEYRSPFARLKLSGSGPFKLYAIKPEWEVAKR